MTETYGWQRYYEAAILETDRARLPALILAAQAAINARVAELHARNDGVLAGTPEERLALADALTGLTVLRKEGA